MRFWLAGLMGIIATGTLVAVGPRESETGVRETEAPSVCERYGELTARMVAARYPEPEVDPKGGLLAEDSGYTGVPIVWTASLPRMSWWCDGERLSVRVEGPWVFYAPDLPSALENMLHELRNGGADPQEDAVPIVLDAFYEAEPAEFEPAGER
jgi:hypothetical protein